MQTVHRRLAAGASMFVACSIPTIPYLSVHYFCKIERWQETRDKLFGSVFLLGCCPKTCTSSLDALPGKTGATNYCTQETVVLAVRQHRFLLVSVCRGHPDKRCAISLGLAEDPRQRPRSANCKMDRGSKSWCGKLQ